MINKTVGRPSERERETKVACGVQEAVRVQLLSHTSRRERRKKNPVVVRGEEGRFASISSLVLFT